MLVACYEIVLTAVWTARAVRVFPCPTPDLSGVPSGRFQQPVPDRVRSRGTLHPTLLAETCLQHQTSGAEPRPQVKAHVEG